MGRPIVRVVMAIGLALLLLGALAAVSLSAAPAEEGVQESGRGAGPVCFWSAQGPVCVERAVGVGATGLDAEGLLAALLAGPTSQERAQGLWSAIPGGTTLEGVELALSGTEVQAGETITVRLRVPLEGLQTLDHDNFEIIVQQIGWTLEPLEWGDLRIQTWDSSAREFVPVAAFLPEIPAPRKETVSPPAFPPLGGKEEGYPPAPGQGQPQGGLSGKTVYVSAGHGWEWNDYVDAWRTQRPPYPNPPYVGPIIEDHNNAEAVNQYLLQYLWNAGASAWPVRERDINSAEVVVDNNGPGPGSGYLETGAWTTTSGTGYAGADYRWTETVTDTPTATAVWTATLPADGEYAVYVWYRPGSDRAPDARYIVHHAGGETTVVVDQQHHGITWHYIGTYGFRAGEEARVTLTNQSAVTETKVVVADAVRFGGGVFDDLSGIQTDATAPPNKPWWEVAAFYYVQKMGMGSPPYGDVTARPIYARWEHAGTGEDAVYVSWHTNGCSGYQWDHSGTETYAHNSEWLTRTEGSLELRHEIHTEVVNDIRAGWDPAWTDRGEKLANLGELRLLWDDEPTVRMPGALIEIAYHDHPDDADALKEPAFELLAARAIYQGIVKYFEQRDGVDLTLLPEPPTHLALRNAGGGQVRVSWWPSPTDTVGLVGDAATGYRVYTSTNGLGWSNGVPVTATTVYTLTGLSEGQLLFVRVTATNEGGESFPTETLAVRVGDDAGVLLVNGFDRLNSTMLVPDYDPVEGYNLRMLLARMNRYDYVVQHGEVISYPFDSASNEAVSDTLVSLGEYAIVDWILGEESVPDETLNATERVLLEAFLDGGGALFLSGAEVGYHLDYLGADPGFYNARLRADYAGDDAESYEVAPASGSIFEGLPPFRFDALGMYDADYPDQMTPVNSSAAALIYSGGQGGTAAVQYADGCERLVYFGFPFETIRSDQRAAVMGRVMDFLALCLGPPVNAKITTPAHGSAHKTTPPFEGTAEAGGTATLDWVEVQVQRASDDRYWTGSEWVTGTAWVTATGTAAWSYTLPTLTIESDYHLRARAWATGGYSDTSPAEVSFLYDTTPPTHTALITPTGGITILAWSGVSLRWEPVAPDGGADLAYLVELDGQPLSSPYGTTQTERTVASIFYGLHTWGVQVFDAAGNQSGWVTDAFHIGRHDCWLPLVLLNSDGTGSACAGVLTNGGFESDGGWVLNRLAAYDTVNVYYGARSVRVGIPPGESGDDAYSSVAQAVALPGGSDATLRLWVYPIGEGDDVGDWHYVGLRDQSGVYHALDHWQSDARAWEQRQYDLSAYLGQTVTLYVGTRNDGDDDTAAMYVDDVVLEVCP
ncbi:MAG: fibronectin type III domain-containing protein [Anaerolineae bacterium]